jgi:hypothetical protein
VRSAVFVTLSFFVASQAFAFAPCESYKKSDPDLYEAVCEDSGGHSTGTPQVTTSSFSDAFHLNSASLPNSPSSYGVEVLGSALRGNSSSTAAEFALIKGYHRFGLGISTGSNETFYSNDVYERVYGPPPLQTLSAREPELGSFTNLNLGTSISLIDLPHGPSFDLGFSARYNEITDTWGGGPALLATWGILTLGGGVTREKVSNLLPWMDFTTFIFGVRIGFFNLEYMILNNIGGPDLSQIHIITGTLSLSRWILSGAARNLNYLTAGYVNQYQLSLQYLFSRHFSLGAVHNYLPGAESVGVQVFL